MTTAKTLLTLTAAVSLTIAAHAQDSYPGQVFRQSWFQKPDYEKAIEIRCVPGLGTAVRSRDWGTAFALFVTLKEKELAYERAFHRPSQALVAATHGVGRVQVETSTGRRW
jgi:hypothetical protein